MSIASQLHEQLNSAGFPVIGVSIGVVEDKRTWRIDWPEEPSKEAVAETQIIVDAFDITAIEEPTRDHVAALISVLLAKGILIEADLPNDMKDRASLNIGDMNGVDISSGIRPT